jgi:hypothetical protein
MLSWGILDLGVDLLRALPDIFLQVPENGAEWEPLGLCFCWDTRDGVRLLTLKTIQE